MNKIKLKLNFFLKFLHPALMKLHLNLVTNMTLFSPVTPAEGAMMDVDQKATQDPSPTQDQPHTLGPNPLQDPAPSQDLGALDQEALLQIIRQG